MALIHRHADISCPDGNFTGIPLICILTQSYEFFMDVPGLKLTVIGHEGRGPLIYWSTPIGQPIADDVRIMVTSITAYGRCCAARNCKAMSSSLLL